MAYYLDELRKGGLIALVLEPKRPSGPMKLKKEAVEFIKDYIKENPRASGGKVHNALEARLHLGIASVLWRGSCQKKSRAACVVVSPEPYIY